MKTTIITILCIYIIIISIISFILMGIDKNKAKRNAWRIPEKALFLPVILGGGLGGILGMRVFHHKTKHWYFAYGFPAIFVIEAVAVVVILVKLL